MYQTTSDRSLTRTSFIHPEHGTFMNRCIHVNNSADKGGVLYNSSFLTDFSGSYHNNMAIRNGGVIALNEASIKVKASSSKTTLQDNSGVLFLLPVICINIR